MHTRNLNMEKCEYSHCVVDFIDNDMDSEQLYFEADALIFQGGRLPKKPPQRANKNQTFIYATIESPLHLQLSPGGSSWKNAINWTMTYRVDSDIPYKYGDLVPKNNTTTKDFSAIFRQKSKQVAWLVSDCVTESKREKYVKILQKYIKVDIYGRCGHFKNCTKDEGQQCLEQIAKDYKFYLSFENSMCNDYMTEKVFVWFGMDIIPVVRGARTYDRLLPPNTYIDAHKFKTISSLAKFLKELSENEQEYVNYLKEKSKYDILNERATVQSAYCELCKRLHNLNDYTRTYQYVQSWWYKNTCVRTTNDLIEE
ncbi:alpha-(1,3)-fucosyltransferase C-like [Mya arenaria]|uniref:alpha-(1,3)-fucosyltransferase C-like n=1 Tax=Mya arenaria TaxID=6604 RepID=UPI0022E5CCF6|nr:alpha-(1,3)-fucosyltransferase C-like [Mya arenaria]